VEWTEVEVKQNGVEEVSTETEEQNEVEEVLDVVVVEHSEAEGGQSEVEEPNVAEVESNEIEVAKSNFAR
jgi:hypothetical protein